MKRMANGERRDGISNGEWRRAKVFVFLAIFLSQSAILNSQFSFAVDCVDNPLLKTTTCTFADPEWAGYSMVKRHHGAAVLQDAINNYLKDRRRAVPDQVIEKAKEKGWDALSAEEQDWAKRRMQMP